MKKIEKIVKRDVDFAKWYTSIIQNSQIVDYGLIKGTMILKPYGFQIWENIKNHLDLLFKQKGVQNCALPTLIPYSEFQKESSHIKGFSPELFKVTELNDKKIEDPYVLRPTSEISFCHYFKNNINSYNDLPLKLNQWCTVFRVEKNTRPFLRTSEFFWQEQHSIFEKGLEAKEFAHEMMILYKYFMNNYLAIPTLGGKKTESEKFAGANTTYTLESIMQDGQVLQCATSHDLGQNFSKPFDIKFQNKTNNFSYGFQTSAGISSRIIGAIIMVHSDDKGLILPPKIAPIQVKINTLFASKNPEITNFANDLEAKLNDFKILVDLSDKQLGFKIIDGELKGVPIQINIGPKDLENEQVEIVIRNKNDKLKVNKEFLNSTYISSLLSKLEEEIYTKAKDFSEASIKEILNYSELTEILISKKVAYGYWAGNEIDEEKIKKETGATIRCVVEVEEEGNCFYTNNSTKKKVYLGRAY